AHRLRQPRVHPIALTSGQYALPSVALKLLMRTGARILFGEHLGEDPVPQSEFGVAKASQPKVLQQFGVDSGAGDDDLRAPGPDSGHSAALLIGQLWQFGGEAAYCA